MAPSDDWCSNEMPRPITASTGANLCTPCANRRSPRPAVKERQIGDDGQELGRQDDQIQRDAPRDFPQNRVDIPVRPGMPEAIGPADVHDQRQQRRRVADEADVHGEAHDRHEALEAQDVHDGAQGERARAQRNGR